MTHGQNHIKPSFTIGAKLASLLTFLKYDMFSFSS